MSGALQVIVLGGGVAGLTAATLLARGGHHVELIDREVSIPRVGTALGLFGPAQEALAAAGVLDAVRARSAAPRSGRVVGIDGTHLATIPAGSGILVSRSHLVRCLLDGLPDEVVRRTIQVEDVRPLRASCDVLVGADGVHSLVRRSGWGAGSRARTHGQTVLRGTAPIAPPDVFETWGGGWLFGITPLHDGTTNWFASLPEHRTPSIADALAHLRDVVGGRRPQIDAVLAAARPERTLVHGIATAPPVWPVREDVVLVGDAAHAMAPNLGHGANTALVDALTLARTLRGAPPRDPRDVRRRLGAYARRRHAPDQAWRVGSALMMRAGTMSLPQARARDRALRAVAPALRA